MMRRVWDCVVAVAFRPRDPSARDAMLTITGSDRRFDIPLFQPTTHR
jgi:hypothetical protein